MWSFNESSDDEDIIILIAALAAACKSQHDETNISRGGTLGKARNRDLDRISVEEMLDKDFFLSFYMWSIDFWRG